MKKNSHIILISKVLDTVSKFIKNLDKETVDKFLLNELELKVSLENKKQKRSSKQKKKMIIDDEKIDNIITKLNNVSSREEAQEYLQKASLKKAELEIILKKLDLPFLKKDNMKILLEKIIEGIIGFKLRSKAIQDLSNE